jgi:hypothetical protein
MNRHLFPPSAPCHIDLCRPTDRPQQGHGFWTVQPTPALTALLTSLTSQNLTAIRRDCAVLGTWRHGLFSLHHRTSHSTANSTLPSATPTHASSLSLSPRPFYPQNPSWIARHMSPPPTTSTPPPVQRSNDRYTPVTSSSSHPIPTSVCQPRITVKSHFSSFFFQHILQLLSN